MKGQKSSLHKFLIFVILGIKKIIKKKVVVKYLLNKTSFSRLFVRPRRDIQACTDIPHCDWFAYKRRSNQKTNKFLHRNIDRLFGLLKLHTITCWIKKENKWKMVWYIQVNTSAKGLTLFATRSYSNLYRIFVFAFANSFPKIAENVYKLFAASQLAGCSQITSQFWTDNKNRLSAMNTKESATVIYIFFFAARY